METGSKTKSTSDFVDELFGEQEGVVYAPTKTAYWNQKFFNWPQQRQELLDHLNDYTAREVYISPILFTEPRVHPSTFKGTYYLYSEFDGTVPDSPSIPPSVRVQSSFSGYEHWYWRLDEFTTDPAQVQNYTKRLAYALEADLSVWDYAVVLRPPGTYNHKRGMPVRLLDSTKISYNLSTFDTLPEAPVQLTVDIDKSKLPELQLLLAKYNWNDDAYDLLTKPLDALGNTTGHKDRSAAMCRLAIHCADMGMANDEIFVVLDEVDQRWKKFTSRTDRERRIEGIISYARSKQAERAEITDDTAVFRFKDFMNTNIKMKWVIPGLLPVAGSAVIFGPSSVGKSTFMLRMAIAIATGERFFLDWPIEREQKILFTSLEMPHDELKLFISQMNLTDEQYDKLQENFFIWPIGHPYPYDTPDQQIEVLKYIDQFGIELNIIDSMGEASYGSISSQDDMKKMYSFLNEDLRKERGCGYFFIHHPRKPSSGENKQPDFNDAYGDSYIINRAQTVINLNPSGAGRIKVSIPKSRLSLENQSFFIKRKNDRSFEKIDSKPTKREAVKDEVYEDSPGILGFGSK